MTKREILKELKGYGIEATLRPRKTILLELLERVRKEHKEGKLTSDVTHMDDIYYTCEKELDPRKPEHPLATIAGFLTLIGVFGFFGIIALEFVSFWSEIPLGHLVGVLAIFGMIFGIPFYVWMLERKYK